MAACAVAGAWHWLSRDEGETPILQGVTNPRNDVVARSTNNAKPHRISAQTTHTSVLVNLACALSASPQEDQSETVHGLRPHRGLLVRRLSTSILHPGRHRVNPRHSFLGGVDRPSIAHRDEQCGGRAYRPVAMFAWVTIARQIRSSGSRATLASVRREVDWPRNDHVGEQCGGTRHPCISMFTP